MTVLKCRIQCRMGRRRRQEDAVAVLHLCHLKHLDLTAAGALLSHIHQFYAADLQPSEQLWLMQQHPHIRRSLQ
eukprot:scaffold2659_cov16-Tisochrysis_lutea.AAC.1